MQTVTCSCVVFLLLHMSFVPGAILVAVAVGRFADNRSPPKKSSGQCGVHLLEGTKHTTFGGDQGGERSTAEAENAEGTLEPFLELESE